MKERKKKEKKAEHNKNKNNYSDFIFQSPTLIKSLTKTEEKEKIYSDLVGKYVELIMQNNQHINFTLISHNNLYTHHIVL